jgi:hypothetical protein
VDDHEPEVGQGERAAGATRSETERRRATVLFADITGFTSLVEQAGDEEAYEIVGACLRLLDAIVVKHAIARLESLAGAGRGDRRAAVRGARQAERDALRGAAKVAARRPEVLRLSGTLALLRGRPRAAARRYEESDAAAESLGMGPERARTWLEAARRGVALRGLDAVSCRSRACGLFEEHELDAELFAAESLRS